MNITIEKRASNMENIVFIQGGGKSYFNEYQTELQQLQSQGKTPEGINSHLQSFEDFMKWREKHTDLFDNLDNAKDLI